jgi:hypothetical protein
MIKLKILCIVIGVLHAISMIFFATGPELSPLVVWNIDFPVSIIFEIIGLEFDKFIYVIITISSIIYSIIFFIVGRLIIKLFHRNKA